MLARTVLDTTFKIRSNIHDSNNSGNSHSSNTSTGLGWLFVVGDFRAERGPLQGEVLWF